MTKTETDATKKLVENWEMLKASMKAELDFVNPADVESLTFTREVGYVKIEIRQAEEKSGD